MDCNERDTMTEAAYSGSGLVVARRFERVDQGVSKFWEITVVRHARYMHAFRADLRFGRANGGVVQHVPIDPITLDAVDALIASQLAKNFIEVAERPEAPESAEQLGVPRLGLVLPSNGELPMINVTEGETYDWRHLVNSEYGSGAVGSVSLLDISYEVLARSSARSDWSVAALNGLVPPPGGAEREGETQAQANRRRSVAISRTGLSALDTLRNCKVIATDTGTALLRDGQVVAALSLDRTGDPEVWRVAQRAPTGYGESPLTPIAMACVLGHIWRAGAEVLGAALHGALVEDWNEAMQVPGFGHRGNHAQYIALQETYNRGVVMAFGGWIDGGLGSAQLVAMGLTPPAGRHGRALALLDLDE
jgi:hypothetical protein